MHGACRGWLLQTSWAVLDDAGQPMPHGPRNIQIASVSRKLPQGQTEASYQQVDGQEPRRPTGQSTRNQAAGSNRAPETPGATYVRKVTR